MTCDNVREGMNKGYYYYSIIKKGLDRKLNIMRFTRSYWFHEGGVNLV